MDKEYRYGLVEEAIKPVYTEGARSQRRKEMKEWGKLYEVIAGVERDFVRDLFASEHVEEISYKDIYEFYHNRYMNNIKYIQHTLKPKLFKVKKTAFAEKFSPQI